MTSMVPRNDGISNTLTTVQKDNYVFAPNNDDGVIEKIGNIYPSGGQNGNVFEIKGISPAISSGSTSTKGNGGIGSNNAPKVVVELTAKERFGRMGEQAVRTQNKLRLPHGETLNPWHEEQSSTNGISPTLTTRPEGFKTAINLTDQYRIRKLTPLECFRLKAVTDEDFYKAQAVNSNSQLYKQAGNSIVVSVLEAIFRNMFLEVPEEDLVGEHIPLF